MFSLNTDYENGLLLDSCINPEDSPEALAGGLVLQFLTVGHWPPPHSTRVRYSSLIKVSAQARSDGPVELEGQ